MSGTAYIDRLEAGFRQHPEVVDYRINLAAGRSIGVGIRDNDIGSMYSPISFSDTISGGFLVQWRDCRLSRGNLDGNSLSQLNEVLAQTRAAAYEDPDAAQFLGPQQIHDVPLDSPDVPRLFDERAEYLLDVVRQMQGVAQRHDARTLNGGVGAGMSTTWLRTSQGLQLSTRSTSFLYSASFDGLIGDGFRRRVVVDQQEIVDQIERVGILLDQLRQPAEPPANGEILVILHPNVAYSMFDYYVWGNMGGAAVYHGQSAWSREDFEARRQVFRPDLQVRVEPWEPLGPGSFAWTGEGWPSRPTMYIDGGCLVHPAVDLKYARRLGLPPNTPPGSEWSVHIEGPPEVGAEHLVEHQADAVLVLSVLGLHTQDRTNGKYSLSASQALLIRDGEIQGKVKAALHGDFFGHLRDGALRMVRFAGQHSPGFAYPGSVAFERI